MEILDEKGIQTELMEFNASIHWSEVLEDCLHSYLQPLRNTKKDPSLLNSYRIVIMMPFLL